jgi:hypothetical protein
LSSPSVFPRSVAVSCLAPSTPCVFACRCRAVCLVVLLSDAVFPRPRLPRGRGQYRLHRRRWCPLPGASVFVFMVEWDHFVPHSQIGRGVECGCEVVDHGGTSQCLVIWCALRDHLLSTFVDAAPILGTFSSDVDTTTRIDNLPARLLVVD